MYRDNDMNLDQLDEMKYRLSNKKYTRAVQDYDDKILSKIKFLKKSQ